MGFTEESDFLGGGGSQKSNIQREDCLKMVGLDNLQILEGGLGDKEGVGVFERGGWYPNAHYGKKIRYQVFETFCIFRIEHVYSWFFRSHWYKKYFCYNTYFKQINKKGNFKVLQIRWYCSVCSKPFLTLKPVKDSNFSKRQTFRFSHLSSQVLFQGSTILADSA